MSDLEESTNETIQQSNRELALNWIKRFKKEILQHEARINDMLLQALGDQDPQGPIYIHETLEESMNENYPIGDAESFGADLKDLKYKELAVRYAEPLIEDGDEDTIKALAKAERSRITEEARKKTE